MVGMRLGEFVLSLWNSNPLPFPLVVYIWKDRNSLATPLRTRIKTLSGLGHELSLLKNVFVW